MRGIPSTSTLKGADPALRAILDALRAEVAAQDKRLTALAATPRTTTVAVQQVLSSTGSTSTGSGGSSAAVLDELTEAPYPPSRPKSPEGLVKPGMFMGWPTAATVPAGWLLCDGSSVSVAAYPALFAAIAYTWGGGGASFSLPNFVDRYLQGATVDELVGTYFGPVDHEIDLEHDHEEGTLATASNGTHAHGGVTSGPSATIAVQSGAGTTVASDTHDHSISSDGAHTHTIDGKTAVGKIVIGGDTMEETDIRPLSAATNWIIKT